MKTILLLLGLALLAQRAPAQYHLAQDATQLDLEAVLQHCFDLPVIADHIQKNRKIMYTNNKAVVKHNHFATWSLLLTHNQKPVTFAKKYPRGYDYYHWNYEFDYIKVDSKRARVKFKYVPDFDTRSIKKRLKTNLVNHMDWRTHFGVDIRLRKQAGRWQVWKYTIEGLRFFCVEEKCEWVKKNYIPLTKQEKKWKRRK